MDDKILLIMLVLCGIIGLVIGLLVGYFGMVDYIKGYTDRCVNKLNECVAAYNQESWLHNLEFYGVEQHNFSMGDEYEQKNLS